MKRLIEQYGVFKLKKRKNPPIHLYYSIMSQQLSTKVADVIFQRYLKLYDDKEPRPQQILETPFEKLQGIGLSHSKVGYVQNVARFEIECGLDHRKLNKMSNDEVIGYLTQIKGVGRWTTEMLLMFALGREDVFAIDDFGIQNTMIKLYGLNRKNKKKFRNDLLAISEKWSPYRTYACMHLWKWKDSAPVKKMNSKKIK